MLTFAGPLLAIAGFVAYFAVALRFRVYRRIPWVFLGITVAGAALGVLEALRHPGTGTAIAALVAVAVLALASWYLFSYSMFASREDRPRVGDELTPDEDPLDAEDQLPLEMHLPEEQGGGEPEAQ